MIYSEDYRINNYLHTQIMVPPKISGRVKWVIGPGEYNLDQVVMTLQHPLRPQDTKDLYMSHFWPVRIARPCKEKVVVLSQYVCSLLKV